MEQSSDSKVKNLFVSFPTEESSINYTFKTPEKEYEKQSEQLDVEKERADNFEHHIEDLTRQLRNSTLQCEKINSDNEDLLARIETLQSNAELLEVQILEVQRAKAMIDKELEAEKLQKEEKIKEHATTVNELEELQVQLQKEKKQLQKTMQELELVKKDAQQTTLMNMEIADYERLMKELNQKLTNKNNKIEDLEQEIKIQKQKQETLEEEITSLQSSVQQYEEKNTKIKQLLVKAKKELADSKQAETDHLILQASLKGEVEASQQQVEVYKIQLAEITSEKHTIHEHLKTSAEQHQRTLSAYQQRVTALQEESRAAKAEQATITSEFESYKVQVHNVLKQQKNKSVSQAETEGAKQERLVDNFCICKGCSLPRCLMYEIYVETCGQNTENQVNPATFGKLVRLVLLDLGTWRLGTRGSARYHYDGICIKKSSFFYAQYCYLIGEKRYHSGDAIAFEKSTNYNSIIQQEATCEDHSPMKTDPVGSPLSEFGRCPFLEQELAKKYSCNMMAFLADEYCNFCRDILRNVRNQELERVEDLLTSFWKSLQQDTIMLMSLPDVCQLFKCYDVQLYKTMRMVLKSKRRVSVLKSDLQAIINQGTLATSKKALASDRSGADELENNPEMKCLRNLISLLGTSTDLRVFLSCLSSHLQAFVFQPSRSKEEFIKLAASFQLRWNLLLTAVSKAMTLCHGDSFGSWHLFHLLLLEYVIHILQSCLEEEEEEEDMGNVKEMLPDDPTLSQPDQALSHPLNSSLSQACASPSVELLGVMLTHMGHGRYPVGVSNMVLRILGFLVDTATGDKLIHVLLEDETTESAVKLSLPMGQEALITLKDGQQFVIQISDVPQSSEDIYFRESNAKV
ncbi:DNA-binding protein RFX8-like isoform X4 [Pongo pygmaeus]|uniref:DNA-binding protein RFX8-like isoform X4 n=1 Tax=Pongo pygmaeus TaxID=9600 RepID=UPI0023E099D5|nr:DNA-binding protein RFX8-like isoform X3 [Pongo pygmaeus]